MLIREMNIFLIVYLLQLILVLPVFSGVLFLSNDYRSTDY